MMAVPLEKNSPTPTLKNYPSIAFRKRTMGHSQAKHNVTVTLGDKGEERIEGTTYGEIHWTEQLFP